MTDTIDGLVGPVTTEPLMGTRLRREDAALFAGGARSTDDLATTGALWLGIVRPATGQRPTELHDVIDQEVAR